ncbi:hypothetical protein [Lacihabitans soyangensis]|uniref:Type 1 periplasmic binding fold superfamily protein n=1 Tax=Lacihabitans soyangensis TaxID=869394 RepID=A0AAE3H441_9BACT|nr:hypothetical protein [Lacihabitans soyangensis]MCP9764548.1 hypothetical protein [Lacihabitans soyangensis]
MKNLGIFVLSVVLGLSACKKEDEIGEENELITTVKLNFKNGNETRSFAYKDLDGDGGMAPTVEKINLKPNTSYDLSVEFLDESKTPALNITEEVKEEGDEHLVVITPSSTTIGTYTYADKDVNLLPIGLMGKFTSKSAAAGSLKIQLRHQPPINGKKSKDGTAAPGSDDINIDFQIEVK